MTSFDSQVGELYKIVQQREAELAEAKQCLVFVRAQQRQEQLQELVRQGQQGALVVNHQATSVRNPGFPSSRSDILMEESVATIIQGTFDSSVQEKARFDVPTSSSETKNPSTKGPAQVNLLG